MAERTEWTAEQKAAYAESKRTEYKEYQIERETTFMNVVQNSQSYKKYLELQTRLTESPINVACLSTVMPDANEVNSYKKWKLKGCRVRQGAVPTKMLSSEEYTDKNTGEVKLGYKVEQVFSDKQLIEEYSPKNVPQISFEKLATATKQAFSNKVDFETAQTEEAYKVEHYDDGVKIGKVITDPDLNPESCSYALLLITGIAELFLFKYVLKENLTKISDITDAGFDIAYMVCYRYAEDKSFTTIAEIDEKRFSDRILIDINVELKEIKRFYEEFSRKILAALAKLDEAESAETT